MAFLELQHLHKRYGDFTAVADMHLDITQGEFISLLGPSGCGKTTTLQMIAGFVEPSRGKVILDGRDITALKPNQRGLGIVFQSYALFPHMTVAENISFGLEMRKIPRAERKRRVQDALELVHLAPFDSRYPRQLSGGQRQRVALARALVIQPPVLLLDEPLSNLDAKLREDMQLELRSIQRRLGTTTILVTHDQSEALSLSDRIVVMNQGQMIQVDAPFQTYEHPGDSFVSDFLGKTNLLDGEIIDRQNGQLRVRVGSIEWDAPGSANLGAVQVSLRPEKLLLTAPADGRVQGRIQTCLFLGNHWLYQIECPLGEILVTRPNDGGDSLSEGAQIGLDWPAPACQILARSNADE